MSIKTYQEASQLQNSCISLPTASVPVATPHGLPCVVWQTKYKLVMCISCVLRVFTSLHAHAKNCMQQCVHMPVFEVLHALNVPAHVYKF